MWMQCKEEASVHMDRTPRHAAAWHEAEGIDVICEWEICAGVCVG